ncbi:MAG: fatty acid desaturase, partial [Bryobacteraceae bacterium]
MVAPGSPYDFYRRNLLAPERVRELNRLRPLRALRDIAVCWLAILAAWLAVAEWTTWWTVLLAIPVIGNRYYALFIIGHDGMHRRLLPDSAANDLAVDLLIFAPIGAITRINNRNHLLHHQHLSTHADPDRFKHACFNKSELGGVLGYVTGVSSVGRSARAVFVSNSAAKVETAEHYTPRDLAILAGWLVVLGGGLT